MGMAIARCILSIGTTVQVALASVWAQREAVSHIARSFSSLSNSIPDCVYFRRQRTRYKQPIQSRDLDDKIPQRLPLQALSFKPWEFGQEEEDWV